MNEELEKILKLWEKDSIVDQTEPGKELLNIPKLHSKYVNLLVEYNLKAKDYEFAYKRIKKIKWEYYTGKLSEEELEKFKLEPFPFTLKSDISIYLESDKDIIKALKEKAQYDECVRVLEDILKELKSRTFQLRDYIAWERFIGGS
jgi:Recombination, repair and ssDNA binding protein UvsY